MLRRFAPCALLAPFAFCACSNDSDGSGVAETLNDADGGADDIGVDDTSDDAADDDAADDDVSAGDDDNVDFGPGTTPTVAEPEPVPVVSEPEPVVDPNAPSADNPLIACPSAVAFGDEPMIDDFEDLDGAILSVDNRQADWYSYNDETPTGTQVLEWVTTDMPATMGMGVLHITGQGFPQYSGLGFGLRWTETGSEACYYDASYYDGLTFWAKGTGGVRVTFQTPDIRPVDVGGRCPADASCYDGHGKDITLSEEWTQFKIGFQGLTQAGWGTPVGEFKPEELFTIEFQFTPGSSYELTLDDVAFYSDDELPPEPVVEPAPEPVVEPTPEPVVEPEPLSDGGTTEPADAGVPATGDASVPAGDAGF